MGGRERTEEAREKGRRKEEEMREREGKRESGDGGSRCGGRRGKGK